MSTATIPAEPTSQPDPNRAGTAMPRIASLLSLVRKLIEYGQNLVTTLQQHPSGPTFIDIAGGFGTIDLSMILARIACGLRRAAALEARLMRRAARGPDFLIEAPVPPPSDTPPKPRAPQRPRPPKQTQDGLPTAEQIAAEIRHKPIGMVIEDICHDLGILFGDLDYDLYRQIFVGITYYNGNLARFLRGMFTRLRTTDELLREIAARPDGHQAPEPSPGLPPDIPSGDIPSGIPPTLPDQLPTGPP
jgi:hypothetical protein